MEAYFPQNVLVTGGAGFIGSHVALRLCLRKYKVELSHTCGPCASTGTRVISFSCTFCDGLLHTWAACARLGICPI